MPRINTEWPSLCFAFHLPHLLHWFRSWSIIHTCFFVILFQGTRSLKSGSHKEMVAHAHTAGFHTRAAVFTPGMSHGGFSQMSSHRDLLCDKKKKKTHRFVDHFSGLTVTGWVKHTPAWISWEALSGVVKSNGTTDGQQERDLEMPVRLVWGHLYGSGEPLSPEAVHCCHKIQNKTLLLSLADSQCLPGRGYLWTNRYRDNVSMCSCIWVRALVCSVSYLCPWRRSVLPV